MALDKPHISNSAILATVLLAPTLCGSITGVLHDVVYTMMTVGTTNNKYLRLNEKNAGCGIKLCKDVPDVTKVHELYGCSGRRQHGPNLAGPAIGRSL